METLKELPGKFDSYDCHQEDETCSICHKSFTDPILTPCAHRFDRRCLREWLRRFHRTCPICSQYMDPAAALKGQSETALYLKYTFEPIWEWLWTVPCPFMPQISVREFLRRYGLWMLWLFLGRVWFAVGVIPMLFCLEVILLVAPRMFDDFYARFFWPYKEVWTILVIAGIAIGVKKTYDLNAVHKNKSL